MSQAIAFADQRPAVGILCTPQQARSVSEGALEDYINAVVAAGGNPKLIPMAEARPQELLSKVDALLIPGGSDVDPALYNQERRHASRNSYPEFDRFEVNCVREALNTGMPMLGICRGQQLMNVAAGGTLIQDINSEVQRSAELQIEHRPWNAKGENGGIPIHMVEVAPEIEGRTSNLKQLLGLNYLAVNSYHHQAVAQVAPIFAVAAWAFDGVIEAIERKDSPVQWAVQWHPERMRVKDPAWNRLFEKLVADAQGWCSQTKIIEEPPTVVVTTAEALREKKKVARKRATAQSALREAQNELIEQLFPLHPHRSGN